MELLHRGGELKMQQMAVEVARHECLDDAVVAITRSKCKGIDLINYQTVIIVGIPDSVEEFVHSWLCWTEWGQGERVLTS